MDKGLERIIKTLKSLEAQIRIEYKAEIVGLFGSYARGEQKDGSDVDILVNFFEGATLFDFVGLANFLEEKLKLKVDIVPIDTVRKEIKDQVLKDAVYL
ncbi:MAG TPA: nucleotidyltransferase family protein [Candidatus Hypogeohydataceae bacterium YC41]